MKEKIEFRGKQAVITVKKSRGKDKWVTVTYPCGEQKSFGSTSIYNQYRESDAYTHLSKCLACKVVLGLSKAKVLQTQQQVANLFGIGKDGFNANGMESKDGFLTYHGDIRAVRTTKGIIMNSQLAYIRSGYSGVHVPTPTKNVIAELPLGTIRMITNTYDFAWMKTIEVLDQNRKEYWIRDSLIIANNLKLLVTRDTNGVQYVIHLPLCRGCETVSDAYECLKPSIVKMYENLGAKVLRQGEFYFVPLENVKDEHVADIQKVVRKTETYCHYDDKLHRVTTLTFPSVDNKEDTHHKATRYGLCKGYNVVKGCIRHENGDHKMLKLPKNTWCIVAKNTQVRSLTVETGDAD